jgi:multidrug efflux pump subunit AcrA (membrane-fusion protein)
MNLRTIVSARPRPSHAVPGATRPPAVARRPALYLAVAAAGALVLNAVGAGEPVARADAQPASVSIAAQLGVASAETQAAAPDAVRPLEQLAASRSERDAHRTAAAQAQADADAAAQAAAAEAARVAAEQAAAAAAAAEAAKQAEAAAAAARPGQGTAAAAAPAGSYQDYAMSKLGGSGSQFSCLENLWGKESGWNPNAQNPSSTAYGIPQFLNSTWAGTGIAKTSDGYRQIDAGLVYIDSRYGSPCGAWSHSQSTGWY